MTEKTHPLGGETKKPSEPERLSLLIQDLLHSDRLADTGAPGDMEEVQHDVWMIQLELQRASDADIIAAVKLLADRAEQNVQVAIAERGGC